MRNVVLYIAMSLDGYVADKSGGVGWLGGDGSDPENMGSYPDFIAGVDTVILGYTTYDQIVRELSPDVWPYEGMHSYVLTRKSVDNTHDITFTNQNPADLIAELRQGQGGDIWICGGANLAAQLMADDCIDRYHLSVIPCLLGQGVSLFSQGVAKRFALESTRSYNGIVDLVYTRRDEK